MLLLQLCSGLGSVLPMKFPRWGGCEACDCCPCASCGGTVVKAPARPTTANSDGRMSGKTPRRSFREPQFNSTTILVLVRILTTTSRARKLPPALPLLTVHLLCQSRKRRRAVRQASSQAVSWCLVSCRASSPVRPTPQRCCHAASTSLNCDT